MRVFRTAAAALGGLLLAVSPLAGTAVAVDGQFVWQGPKGKPYSIQNPPNNKCYDMGQEARAAQNFTKGPLAVFAKKKCQGAKRLLAPGQKTGPKDAFQSVIFSPK